MKRSLIAGAVALLTTAAVIAVGIAAATTATASAAAVVTRASITTTGTNPQPSDNCGTGIATGTDTVTYTSVQTPTGGFHIAGTDTGTARVDWPDGSYTLEGFTDHFSVVATAGTTVVTDAHTDFAYNYSADGALQSQGKFYATEHFTVTNGVIVRVDFEFNHVHGTFC